MSPDEIDHVNAHGTSTVLNDAAETKALKLALGEHAQRVPVSAIKSMTGARPRRVGRVGADRDGLRAAGRRRAADAELRMRRSRV